MATNINVLHQASLKWHEKIAIRITGFVGSMICAVVFAFIAVISLPAAIGSGSVIVIIGWLAQTFLQLVLLSIIMVGQNLQQRHSEFLAEETYRNVMRDEQETESIHRKLDRLLSMVDE